jgi:hypothetical protein
MIFELETRPGVVAKVLLDCGSTTNFISRRFVYKHSIPTVKSDRVSVVKLADGSSQTTCRLVQSFPLYISNRQLRENLLVLPIENFDIILGMPWLRKHNPIIDWSTDTLTFPPSPLQLILAEHGITPSSISSSTSSSSLNSISSSSPSPAPIELCHLRARDIKKAIRKNESVFLLLVRRKPGSRDIEFLNHAGADTGVSTVEQDLTRKITAEFADVFPEELPKGLPPKRFMEHHINLVPGSKPPFRNHHRLSPQDLDELKAEITRLLDLGFIRVAHSPYGCPVVFAKKPGETKRRLCFDYRDLNKITINDRYPIPRVDELLDRLAGAKYFSKLDLRSGYHQIRVADRDIEKTTFNTRYGSYEFLVLPFGLKGAVSTFMSLMNQVLSEYLDKFVVVYLDDILIYSNTLEEHAEHVRAVLETLRKEKLYCKESKCEFFRNEVKFLGYIVGAEGLKVDPAKVEAVKAWPIPNSVTDVRSFLGFVGFYRKFIAGHSRLTAPLSDLTKDANGVKFKWNAAAQESFEKMKEALCNAPVLVLPDPKFPYIVTTDASGFAIGACLQQDQGSGLQPIAYMSKKMLDAETRYPIHHKELLAIVVALKEWRHYLHGTKFTVRVLTDHRSLVHFETQPKLSDRQARWNEFLSEFDYVIEYQEGKKNVCADALSRRPDHASVDSKNVISLQTLVNRATVSAISTSLTGEIQEGYKTDDFAKNILNGIRMSRVDHFTVKENLIWYDNYRIFVPDVLALKTKIISECHDGKLAMHVGFAKTYDLVAKSFYWPNMYNDIKKYVHTCLICQKTKAENKKKAGLLFPHKVPTKRWQVVTMDFITQLPRSKNGYNAIMVVVDKLSKRAYFIPCTTNVTAPEVALLYFKRVVANGHGVPQMIISDRDSKFTSLFWSSLWSLLDTKLELSTANHQETDGQTEIVNRTLEQMLRAFANAKQDNWCDLLPYAEIAYNNSKHTSTGYSPFYLNSGEEMVLPLSLREGRYTPDTGNATVEEMLSELGNTLQLVQKNLLKAQEYQKKYADKNRRHEEYEIGDKVLLDAEDITFTAGSKKLLDKYIGPYTIVEKASHVVYKLDLPDKFRIHPYFHVSKLRRYKESDDFPDRVQNDRPAPVAKIGKDDAWYVEKVVGKRKKGNKIEYLVKWEGYPDWENSWEPAAALKKDAGDAIAEYERNKQNGI